MYKWDMLINQSIHFFRSIHVGIMTCLWNPDRWLAFRPCPASVVALSGACIILFAADQQHTVFKGIQLIAVHGDARRAVHALVDADGRIQTGGIGKIIKITSYKETRVLASRKRIMYNKNDIIDVS